MSAVSLPLFLFSRHTQWRGERRGVMEDQASRELRMRRAQERRRRDNAIYMWKVMLVMFIVFAIIGWLVE